jgi:hypothetical protein
MFITLAIIKTLKTIRLWVTDRAPYWLSQLIGIADNMYYFIISKYSKFLFSVFYQLKTVKTEKMEGDVRLKSFQSIDKNNKNHRV